MVHVSLFVPGTNIFNLSKIVKNLVETVVVPAVKKKGVFTIKGVFTT